MSRTQNQGYFVKVGFVPVPESLLGIGQGAIVRVQSPAQPYSYLSPMLPGDDPQLIVSPANTVREVTQDGVFIRRTGGAPLVVDAGGHTARIRATVMSEFGQPKGDAAVTIATSQDAIAITAALGDLVGCASSFDAAPAYFQVVSSTADDTLGQIDVTITFDGPGSAIVTMQYGCDYATLRLGIG